MLFLLVFLLAVSVVTVQQSRGQPGEERGYPFITNISPDEYEGHVQNWGFAADSNGVIYVANMSGVLRYDGVNWSSVEIPNARILSIANDFDGRVYVGGIGEIGYLTTPQKKDLDRGNGYLPGNGNVDETLAPVAYRSLRSYIPDTVQVDNVWEIEVSGNDVVFHTSNILFRYDGTDLTTYYTDTRFTTVFTMGDDFYVRESNHGIKRLGADELHPWEPGNLFIEETLQGYLNANENNIFCSFFECFYFEDDSLTPMQTAADDYLRENYIHEVHLLSDNTMAIATRNGGIVQMTANGELIRIIDESTGLINNTVYGLFEDHSGALWVATVNGISRVEIRLPFRRFDDRNGISEYVRWMTIFDDVVFLSSTAGVYRLDDDGYAHLYDGKTSCGKFLDYRDDLYVVCTGALYRYTGDGFDQMTSNRFADVVAPFEDELLVAVEEAAVSFVSLENNEKQVFYKIDNFSYRPNSLQIDSRNNIWIGTESYGLIRIEVDRNENGFQGHTITRYLDELDNPAGDGRVYVTELNGTPAFLTWGKGIQRFNHDNNSLEAETRYGPDFSDPEQQVFWAEEDRYGNVWFRSDQRYQVAMRDNNGNYHSGDQVLNRLDDRQSNAIYPDEEGSIWYLTERGLVRYDGQHEFDSGTGFHTTICEVFVRADSLIATGGNDNPVVLDYQDNELRFTYAAATYDAPGYTKYRVKLEGFDEAWSVWSSETRKDYTNIPEGHYRFLVEAENVYGTVSAAAPFHLQIKPPWYRTIWAYLLYIFTVGGVLYTAYSIRLNQILRVQRIRNDIAGDLHDEISATLSSISFFAKAIESRKTTGDKTRFVQLIAESAGEAKEKISDIVWAINPDHDDWKSFLSRCRRYTSDLLESSKITYTLNIDLDIPGKMDMRLRQHLWLIYKEMIINAVRHSKGTHVHVVIRHSGGRLTMIVQDNGNGMDQKADTGGNGLRNIRRRAELIKGEAVLDTDPGMGTRWKITVKI